MTARIIIDLAPDRPILRLTYRLAVAAIAIAFCGLAPAQKAGAVAADGNKPSFADASATFEKRLEAATKEFAALQAKIAEETIPLNRALREAESELSAVRETYRETTALTDRGDVKLERLAKSIKAHQEQNKYLSNLLVQYTTDFESRVHIAELDRYRASIDAAKLAPEKRDISERERLETQVALLTRSLERLEELLGGARFEGRAIDADGLVTEGTFMLIGPAAFFRSEDGAKVGTAEQRLGSLEPAVLAYPTQAETASAGAAIEAGAGTIPLDPSLGDAHKVASTEVTLIDEFHIGGPVMWPIVVLAAVALLIALYKLVELMLVPKLSRKRFVGLLDAVDRGDRDAAEQHAHTLRGPSGRMLLAGVEHLDEPPELVEEVMYERVLTTRLKLQRLLPFIAICAAASPLLGLLGTVTGIIETFKMITIFGSGDVKNLSGGISQALLTTKWGLCVAIPALLLHAFLSRKAKRMVGDMESAGMQFINHVNKAPRAARTDRPATAAAAAPPALVTAGAPSGAVAPDANLVREQVNEILSEMLGPLTGRKYANGKNAEQG